MTTSIDLAFGVLKALPEQQMFTPYLGHASSRRGTVHPIILEMLKRRNLTDYPSLHVGDPSGLEDQLHYIEEGPRSDLTDLMREMYDEKMAQRERGSLFAPPPLTEPDYYEGPSIPYEDRFGEAPVGPDTRFRPPPVPWPL